MGSHIFGRGLSWLAALATVSLIAGPGQALAGPAAAWRAPGPVATLAAGASASTPVFLTPRVIGIGQWAEGLAYDGRWLWAAESGQRTIAKIDLRGGRVVSRVKVGRLPVSMASAGNGAVYGLVETDKTIWRQPAKGHGAVFAHVPGCPQGLTLIGGNLWALTWPDCSSNTSQLVRIKLRDRQQANSPQLGEWGEALAGYGNQIWLAHARGPAISITDQTSMRTRWLDVRGASLWSITANSRYVFAGGRVEENNDAGLVIMFDPQQGVELARVSVSERVAEIAGDDRHVVAVGAKGTIWVFSASDFRLERTISLTTGKIDPRSAMILGDSVVLTASTYHGSNGAVLVLERVLRGIRPPGP